MGERPTTKYCISKSVEQTIFEEWKNWIAILVLTIAWQALVSAGSYVRNSGCQFKAESRWGWFISLGFLGGRRSIHFFVLQTFLHNGKCSFTLSFHNMFCVRVCTFPLLINSVTIAEQFARSRGPPHNTCVLFYAISRYSRHISPPKCNLSSKLSEYHLKQFVKYCAFKTRRITLNLIYKRSLS